MRHDRFRNILTIGIMTFVLLISVLSVLYTRECTQRGYAADVIRDPFEGYIVSVHIADDQGYFYTCSGFSADEINACLPDLPPVWDRGRITHFMIVITYCENYECTTEIIRKEMPGEKVFFNNIQPKITNIKKK